MKKTFSARRVPRKIGQDDGDDEEAFSGASSADHSSDATLRKPTIKPRKSSGLRTGLGPSVVNDDWDSEAAVITPKRSTLSRVAIQRNASKRPPSHPSQLPGRQNEDEDGRPSYSAASLRELKDSTPTTPQQSSPAGSTDIEDVQKDTQALDLSSKFGSSLARYQESSALSAIPSAAVIAEKKARRARLAKEKQAEEFISLDPDDPDLDDEDEVMKDEHGRLVLKPKDKYGLSESRLVRDDEDIMENFDDFTEDGKISLGQKAEAEAARKQKQEMAAQIAEAEGASGSDSDDSELERNAAFEAAQTKHGTYAQTATDSDPADARPKTPPIITPIPSLGGVIDRLRKQVADVQSSRMQKLQEMENLQREKIRLAEEEIRIQRALKETAEKFEQLRKEKGISDMNKDATPEIAASALPYAFDASGQIELGDEAPGTRDVDDDDGHNGDNGDEDDRPSFASLRPGGVRRGLGTALGSGPPAAANNSDSDMAT